MGLVPVCSVLPGSKYGVMTLRACVTSRWRSVLDLTEWPSLIPWTWNYAIGHRQKIMCSSDVILVLRFKACDLLARG